MMGIAALHPSYGLIDPVAARDIRNYVPDGQIIGSVVIQLV